MRLYPGEVATLGVASYRLAQYVFPVVLGGLLYISLRVGPGKIERRERVKQCRDIAGIAECPRR